MYSRIHKIVIHGILALMHTHAKKVQLDENVISTAESSNSLVEVNIK